MIGSCYSKGVDVKQNDEKAVDWWRKAAEQGHAISQSLLGYAYNKGKGVTKDSLKAVYWYSKSAEQGNTVAQMELSLTPFIFACFLKSSTTNQKVLLDDENTRLLSGTNDRILGYLP